MKEEFFYNFPELGMYVYRASDQGKVTELNLGMKQVNTVDGNTPAVNSNQLSTCATVPNASMPFPPDTHTARQDLEPAVDLLQYDLYTDLDINFLNDLDPMPAGYFTEPFQNTTNGYFIV
jgi:hypothetical protein